MGVNNGVDGQAEKANGTISKANIKVFYEEKKNDAIINAAGDHLVEEKQINGGWEQRR